MNELATVERRGACIVADALTHEGEQRKLLGQYVAQHMTEGTDYGVIPGTKNKTLLKPGAEKLTQLFRCIPRYVVEAKIEDWNTGLFHYRFSCQIVTQADGTVVAEGVGSCSTFESRYRYRVADRACPICGAAAIMKSKFPPKGRPEELPGWYCFSKKGGCGQNFEHDDEDITSQKTGRIQNPDILDAVNTVLKIAKKRALVDAAIALARCSDIFTQDMEDFAEPDATATPKAAPVNVPAHVDTPPPVAKKTPRDILSAEMKRTDYTWLAAMEWLQSRYPTDPVPYTVKTRFGDIEPKRIEELTRFLQTQLTMSQEPAYEPSY